MPGLALSLFTSLYISFHFSFIIIIVLSHAHTHNRMRVIQLHALMYKRRALEYLNETLVVVKVCVLSVLSCVGDHWLGLLVCCGADEALCDFSVEGWKQGLKIYTPLATPNTTATSTGITSILARCMMSPVPRPAS